MSEIQTLKQCGNLTATPSFYLASSSPRRQQLLRDFGYSFLIVKPSIDEAKQPFELPLAYVQRMAVEKSVKGFSMNGCFGPTLGADTVVCLDNQIIGKPQDRSDAKRILSMLSGRVHNVVTAIALTVGHGSTAVDHVVSEVLFKPLTDSMIEDYINTGEPMDKAGAYGIQGLGSNLVVQYTGSLSNIIGLPMDETAAMLASYGIFSDTALMGAGVFVGGMF